MDIASSRPYAMMSESLTSGTSCYFDLPQTECPHNDGETPISPYTVAKKKTAVDHQLRGSASRRTRSDYSTVLKRVHVQAIEEDLPDSLPMIHASPLDSLKPTPKEVESESITEDSKRYQKDRDLHFKDSLHITRGHAKNRSLPSSQDSHAYPPRRPRLGHMWARTQSGGVWFETQRSASERQRRSSSSNSNMHTSTSDYLQVRTQQTPLKPPPSRSVSTPVISGPSSVRVEISFTESDPKRRSDTEDVESQNEFVEESFGSRQSSTKLRHIFSTSRSSIRRPSLPKSAPKITISHAPEQLLVSGPDSRMADHSSLLKRNYTSDALQRVTTILQDIKHSGSGSIWLPVLKPFRLRAQTDKSTSSRDRKYVQTVQGITSQCTMVQKKSQEPLSDVHSYTSSQINMRMGPQPANTPDEQATYKVKRSPSAQTEDFLKVDISIRGGTSYLPSEARRIHTPPLPEETQDGRLKGFFFDYNAPRSESSRDGVFLGSSVPGGSPRPVKGEEEARARSTTMGQTLPKTKSGRCKRFHTGDWYDIKLAELDVVDEGDQHLNRNDSNADCRVFSPAAFSQCQKRKEEEQFDYTIPEHLPSSPLCPRNPRYWRVVRGKGSQFRGCWMHGIGE